MLSEVEGLVNREDMYCTCLLFFCRYRIQAENVCGKGSFSSFNSGSTLPPPPSPPLLILLSCSHHTLKLSWGKRQSKSITYILDMQTQGGK